MVYELRLHIGQEFTRHPGMGDFNKQYGVSIEQIAVLHLSGVGSDSHIMAAVTEAQTTQKVNIEAGLPRYRIDTDVYHEAENEYAKLFEDKYGLPVAPIPLREAYAAILHDYAISLTPGHKGSYQDGYRRLALAITIFEAVLNRFPERDGNRPLVALTYGY